MGTALAEEGLLRAATAWLPANKWLGSYTGGRFKVDLVAGLSLATFVIPELLAYASFAQLPPVTGLYCHLVAGIAYALFGTSRQLAVGPTSSLAIVVATGVAAISGGDPTRFVALASAIALMVGVVSITGRYIGLANAAYFISDPVLVGFKTGAAFYIASTQLPKLFGIEGVSGNFFTRIWQCRAHTPPYDRHGRRRRPGSGRLSWIFRSFPRSMSRQEPYYAGWRAR
jgi:SulP family sulfate permease